MDKKIFILSNLSLLLTMVMIFLLSGIFLKTLCVFAIVGIILYTIDGCHNDVVVNELLSTIKVSCGIFLLLTLTCGAIVTQNINIMAIIAVIGITASGVLENIQ